MHGRREFSCGQSGSSARFPCLAHSLILQSSPPARLLKLVGGVLGAASSERMTEARPLAPVAQFYVLLLTPAEVLGREPVPRGKACGRTKGGSRASARSDLASGQ